MSKQPKKIKSIYQQTNNNYKIDGTIGMTYSIKITGVNTIGTTASTLIVTT
jgi:hypothetical protein